MKNILLLLVLINISKADWNILGNVSNGAGIDSKVYSDGINIYLSPGPGYQSIIISTNGGYNWSSITGNLPIGISCQGIVKSGNNLYASLNGSPNQVFYKSTNGGVNWSLIAPNVNSYFLHMFENNGIIWCHEPYSRLKRYYSNTNTWDTLLINYNVSTLSVRGNEVMAVVFDSLGYHLKYSSNGGSNWISNNQPNFGYPRDICINQGKIFFAFYNGIQWTNDYGVSWHQTFNSECFCLDVINNVVFGGVKDGVIKTTDNGTSWQNCSNNQLDSIDIYKLSHNNNYLVGIGQIRNNGSSNGETINRLISELIGIEILSNEVPKKFSLDQNYPNPFNPTTQIELSIPKSSFVVLKVYDMLGKELEILVKQELSPGVYKVDFDATKYPSGIYFYRLETANFTTTKKMIVVK